MKGNTLKQEWISQPYLVWESSYNYCKCLGISQLVYLIWIIDTPSEYIKATNLLFLKFIWKKSKRKLNKK